MIRKTAIGDHTALVLMKGPEADATIEALRDSGQQVEVRDESTFWKIVSKDDIHVDLDLVSEFLGSPLNLGRWLVGMSTFVGYIETDETNFWVHADRGAAVVDTEPVAAAS